MSDNQFRYHLTLVALKRMSVNSFLTLMYSIVEKKPGDLQKVVDDLETIVDDLAHRRNCVEISGINPAADQSCEALV